MASESMNGVPYKVQVAIDRKYRPLILRGRLIHEQTPRSAFPEKRKAGETNLDLWLDGSIYPADSSGKRPKFSDVRSLLEFVGEGENGLLGYMSSLVNYVSPMAITELASQHRESEFQYLSQCVDNLTSSLQQQGNELHNLHELESRQRSQLHVLYDENCELQSRLTSLRAYYDPKIVDLQNDLDESVRSEIALESDIDSMIRENDQKQQALEQSHKVEYQKLKLEHEQIVLSLSRLQKKWGQLQATPYGYRKQVRKQRDISTLSQTGGQAKVVCRLARSVIAPSTVQNIQEGNVANRKKQRLHGSEEQQIESGKMLAKIWSKTEVKSMLNSTTLKSVSIDVTNQYLSKIGVGVGPHEILAICDRSGITEQGYASVYKKFKGGAKAAGKGIRIGCLPKPYHVSLLRKQMNSKLTDFVGEYYSINNSLEILPNLKSKKKETVHVKLTENNSLFVDVEQVQRTMVQLYRITPTELAGKPLIFVLKLDEAEIVHSQKLERVSITLMNRALNPNILIGSEEYFAVQSEREIWPIGCFQIPKESHEILSWVFRQTRIPTLIEAQEAGQKLTVPEIGDFAVEWHLSADMKSIKCMYGLNHGAYAKQSCIYCLQERVKPTIGTMEQAAAVFSKRATTLDGGLFCTHHVAKPITRVEGKGRWKPILPIPMDRVHMCTLHAFNRIVEKIIHLHFQFIWTIRDKSIQKIAIEDMQHVLSSTGAHGGNVIIFKDNQLSGKQNNIPSKPSFNGAHAGKLFEPSKLPGGANKLYSDVVTVERNFISSGVPKRAKLDVWIGLEKLKPYFEGLILSDNKKAEFKGLADAWGRQFIRAYGEHHVTHYIRRYSRNGTAEMEQKNQICDPDRGTSGSHYHAFVKHAPWFISQYGSLSIWSCQGMEYSHYAAKAAYQRHTQHGGGRTKKSPLVQTYQHWYRIIQHRFHEQMIKENATGLGDGEDQLTVEARIQRRREASAASSANAHSSLWHQKCQRVGSKWVPQDDSTGRQEDETNHRSD